MNDLSIAVGLSVVSVSDQVRGDRCLLRRGRKIENFLGAAIWTSLERFEQLNRASRILGADAVLTDFHELRRRAIALRIPKARNLTSKDRLVAVVLAHCPEAIDFGTPRLGHAAS